MNSANYLVVITSAPDRYLYKRTYRCEMCKNRAKRSYQTDLEIKKL